MAARVWVVKPFVDAQGEHVPGDPYEFPVDTPHQRARFASLMAQGYLSETKPLSRRNRGQVRGRKAVRRADR